MEESLNDAHGLAIDVATFGEDVNVIALYTDKGFADVLEALTVLTEAFARLADTGKLANTAILEMYPRLLSLATDPAFMPRRLKKAYWKLFENRPITWRERRKLNAWCNQGHTTLDKLSGKQVSAQTPD